jgi:pimeloyl-ACP methyl ester carboxylesterase
VSGPAASQKSGRPIDAALAVLNGVVGDYLARTRNGLAIEMSFVRAGVPVVAAALDLGAAPRVVVLVHGLMCTEDIFKMDDGADYGTLLARDLGLAPLYVRYNTGLPIADSGAALDALLDELVAAWPGVGQIDLLGYSMGGLVARAACHAAAARGAAWLSRVTRAVYVGTPHLGAPMERVGRFVSRVLRAVDDPYTRLVADLADLRSDGVKDLGDADLRHEDRARRVHAIALRDPAHPVPLLASIHHGLVAGSLFGDPHLAALFGDAVVPLTSATNAAQRIADGSPMRAEDVVVLRGLSHVDVPRSREVYPHVLRLLSDAPAAEAP